MKNRIVVLGNGFLGRKFAKRAFRVFGKDQFKLTPTYKRDLNSLDPYDTVINCIGKSNTRWCEQPQNFDAALFSNGYLPGILSNYCKEHGKQFVHISTGCLYDRNDRPQNETDFISAHCNYTVTKWIGEKKCNDQDLIIRPRLYFGDFPDKNNLLSKLPKFQNFLRETNSYTSLDTIVDSINVLLLDQQSGVFNVACDGYASVREIADWLDLLGGETTQEELHKSEKLYLVNNIMDISKLKKHYEPPQLKKEILRCDALLK